MRSNTLAKKNMCHRPLSPIRDCIHSMETMYVDVEFITSAEHVIKNQSSRCMRPVQIHIVSFHRGCTVCLSLAMDDKLSVTSNECGNGNRHTKRK